MYEPYVVPQYPHILYSGYLHTSSIRLPSSMMPPNSSKMMSEYRRKMSNITPNEIKNKIRDATIRIEE